MTTATRTEIPQSLSWAEIIRLYPEEWVVLGDPALDGTQVLSGVVISHHADKRSASMEGGEQREGFKKFTLTFTGQPKPVRRIGILNTCRQVA
jgi:hypothetical protein